MTTLIAPSRVPAPDVPPGIPRLSIVIAAYQAADTIAETLDSVLDQTRAAHEIVVCDDGSTDDLLDVLAGYGDAVRVLRQPNRGFASARNTATWNTTGDAVAYVDADDTVDRRYVEALTDAMAERPDLEMVAGDVLYERDGRVLERKSDIDPFPVSDQVERFFQSCYIMSPAIRRARILAVGGFDESLRIAADWDLWLRVLLSGTSAGLVNEPLLHYRLVAGSLSDDRAPSLRERVVVLEKAERDPRLTPAQRAALAGHLRRHRARAVAAEADTRAAGGEPGARIALLRSAASPGQPRSERLRQLSWAAWPARARAHATSGTRRPIGD